MTEWNASEYALISGLQKAMAEEVLGLLDVEGSERILDVGCGDGKIKRRGCCSRSAGRGGGCRFFKRHDQLCVDPLRSRAPA